MEEKKSWGGAREGAGRKRTAPDGELRKQRQTRATDAEWELIKEFAAILKKDPERAKRMLIIE